MGETLTDCYVVREGKSSTGKPLTTGYDLSVGLVRAMEAASSELGLTVEELLGKTESIRAYLAKRAQTGVNVTEGHEDVMCVGRVRLWAGGLPVAVY